jgi:hypothetical protein
MGEPDVILSAPDISVCDLLEYGALTGRVRELSVKVAQGGLPPSTPLILGIWDLAVRTCGL